jgi:hypothetical protein
MALSRLTPVKIQQVQLGYCAFRVRPIPKVASWRSQVPKFDADKRDQERFGPR